MKIGLISDTHGYWDERYVEYFKDCDEIWHAGDMGTIEIADKFKKVKPFRAVYGNCDGYPTRLEYPRYLSFEIEGVSVLMTHIGGYPGRYAPEIKEELDKFKPKLFISGHSHILKVKYDKRRDLLHINPGAAGIQGFHVVRTIVRFVIEKGAIKDLDVIELGPND